MVEESQAREATAMPRLVGISTAHPEFAATAASLKALIFSFLDETPAALRLWTLGQSVPPEYQEQAKVIFSCIGQTFLLCLSARVEKLVYVFARRINHPVQPAGVSPRLKGGAQKPRRRLRSESAESCLLGASQNLNT